MEKIALLYGRRGIFLFLELSVFVVQRQLNAHLLRTRPDSAARSQVLHGAGLTPPGSIFVPCTIAQWSKESWLVSGLGAGFFYFISTIAAL
jgi:hypothetical protein